MKERSRRLLQTIVGRAGRSRRVPLPEVWTAFGQVLPHLRGHPAARGELLELLEALAQAGAIRLPIGRRSYDAVQAPPLPRWIELPASERSEMATERAAQIAWHPALEFARAVPRLGDEELDALVRIQRFLAEMRPDEPCVSARERSLRLFGDEKKLERLATGRLFGSDRISLDLLRCRLVHVPFVFRDFGCGTNALIIENKDTFSSACLARRELSGRSSVRWIIFGGGNGILRSIPSMLDWSEIPRHLLYFGDIDRRGLEIAVKLGATVEAIRHLPPLVCADTLYERLVEHASQHGPLKGSACPTDRSAKLVVWLPAAIRGRCSDLLERGGRWPQEWVIHRDFVELLGRYHQEVCN